VAAVIWLIRHAERSDGPRGVARPEHLAADPALTAHGRWQATQLAHRLEGEDIRHLVASPYRRTLETAAPIAEATALRVRQDPGACEFLHPSLVPGQPVWTGTAVDSDYRSHPTPVYPETVGVFASRVDRVFHGILANLGWGVCIVTHGAWIAAITSVLIGLDTRFPVPPASVTSVHHDGTAWRLQLAGAIDHLGQ